MIIRFYGGGYLEKNKLEFNRKNNKKIGFGPHIPMTH